MSPDNAGKSNADQNKAKKPEPLKDLNAENVSGKDAEQVKGGLRFNPQPDPPAAQALKKDI